MGQKTLDDASKFSGYVLHYQSEAIGLTLDGQNWADIGALVVGAAWDDRILDRVLLGVVVENNDKKCSTLSVDD